MTMSNLAVAIDAMFMFESTIATIPIETEGLVRLDSGTSTESVARMLCDVDDAVKRNIAQFIEYYINDLPAPPLCGTGLLDISIEFTYKRWMVKKAMDGRYSYATLSSIAMATGLNINEVKWVIDSDNDTFRKSIIRTKTGDEVYMLNTRFSGIVDAWRAFRHFNAWKY